MQTDTGSMEDLSYVGQMLHPVQLTL